MGGGGRWEWGGVGTELSSASAETGTPRGVKLYVVYRAGSEGLDCRE